MPLDSRLLQVRNSEQVYEKNVSNQWNDKMFALVQWMSAGCVRWLWGGVGLCRFQDITLKVNSPECCPDDYIGNVNKSAFIQSYSRSCPAKNMAYWYPAVVNITCTSQYVNLYNLKQNACFVSTSYTGNIQDWSTSEIKRKNRAR